MALEKIDYAAIEIKHACRPPVVARSPMTGQHAALWKAISEMKDGDWFELPGSRDLADEQKKKFMQQIRMVAAQRKWCVECGLLATGAVIVYHKKNS